MKISVYVFLLSLFCFTCSRGVNDEYFDLLVKVYERDAGNSVDKCTKHAFRENIKIAVEASEFYMNASLIDERNFRNFVLPSQINSAKDYIWRATAKNKFGDISSIKRHFSKKSFRDSCLSLNYNLGMLFKFGRVSKSERSMTYQDLLNNKMGSCVGMTHFAAYTFRALGIPVAVDMAPAWGNINSASGHQWNVLMLKDEYTPFMGTESKVADYEPLLISRSDDSIVHVKRIPPKVFRECKHCKDAIPLMDMWVIDVTKDYTETRDIIVKTNSSLKSVQLAIFSKGKFNIVTNELLGGENYIFKNMAVGLAYFPILLNEAGRTTIGSPISLDFKGNQQNHLLDYVDLTHMTISALNSIADTQTEIINDFGFEKLHSIKNRHTEAVCPRPENNQMYKLFAWNDNGWAEICSSIAKENTLKFYNVPSKGLYVVSKDAEGIKKTRPFAYRRGEQNWM